MSVMPPAAHGTTTRTGLSGHAACAEAKPGNSKPLAAQAEAARVKMRREEFMVCLQ
jgi:hypothetical protein